MTSVITISNNVVKNLVFMLLGYLPVKRENE